MVQIFRSSPDANAKQSKAKAYGRYWHRLALICAIFLSVPLVLSTGISNFLTERAPDLALAVNPYNQEARIDAILAGLARARTGPDPRLRESAERLVAQ